MKTYYSLLMNTPLKDKTMQQHLNNAKSRSYLTCIFIFNVFVDEANLHFKLTATLLYTTRSDNLKS